MKTKQLVALLAVVTLLASSCSVSKTTSSTKTLDPKTDLLIADLEVGTQKVTGEFRYDAKKNAVVDTDALIENAIYNALAPLKADVLVAPQHQVVQEIRGRKYYTVTVSGYPAYFRNFRPYSMMKDVEFKEINGIVYVVPKNSNGEPTGYQVVVPNDKEYNTIDMDLVQLDQIVFNGGDQTLGSGKVKKVETTMKDEKKSLFSSIKEKVGGKKKSK